MHRETSDPSSNLLVRYIIICNVTFFLQKFLIDSKSSSGDLCLADFIHYVREHEKNLKLHFSNLDKNRDGKWTILDYLSTFWYNDVRSRWFFYYALLCSRWCAKSGSKLTSTNVPNSNSQQQRVFWLDTLVLRYLIEKGKRFGIFLVTSQPVNNNNPSKPAYLER